MADADTARLCVQIVHTHFGPLTAKIVSLLLTRGRLNLSQLVRFSSLKPRSVRAAIIALVQHNILWHAQTEEEGEVLEVNVDECLMRLRFGRFVWQADQLFGKAAAQIVQLILDNGKLRPPDIISHCSSYDPKGSTVKCDALLAGGVQLKYSAAASSYSQALFKLVSSSYLKPSTILAHQSPRDKRIKYEAEERAKISGLPTAKELRQMKETAEARLKREEQEAEQVGLKRQAVQQTGHKSSTKRKAVDEDVVDGAVFFRVNYERFGIHIRNQLIVTAVRERFNDSAAAVMKAALKATESKQMNVSEPRSDPISLANISMEILDDEDLTAGLYLPSSQKKPSTMSLIKDYVGLLACADNPTPIGRATSFVSFGGSKVQVEFEIICRRLQRRVLEAVTRERHGDDGVRILRLLLDSGKIDEKQISKIAMMAAKDLRPLLSALSTDALISLQEVPRSADRNPTRTFYLWYVDLTKTYSVLLGYLYKTLFNISMRRRAEEEEPGVQAVLVKRERSDVSQDEGLLTRVEREILQEWESKREKSTVLEMRVEEAVFILRDLGVLGINDD